MHIPTVIFILLLLSFSSRVVHGDEESDFFRDCPVKRCSYDGPEVRYPLHLKHSTPKFCGFPGLELSCSGLNQTLLTLPSATFTVADINYTQGTITTKSLAHAHPCPLGNLTYVDDSHFEDTLFLPSYYRISLLSCSKIFTPTDDDYLVGPVSCLSGGDDNFVYAANAYRDMDGLPLDCMVVAAGLAIPDDGWSSFRSAVETFTGEEGIILGWRQYSTLSQYWGELDVICGDCEAKGKSCWFSHDRNQTFCTSSGRHGPGAIFIAGTSTGGLFVLIVVSAALIFFYIVRRFDKGKEARLKVETFLTMYRTTNPTRYTYSDIKKITKRFRKKLGQGGFGSVYKGELPNGVPVAVKMLEKSRGKGAEFTNEVSTIGRIHHANVVRLLGFFSEGARYGLVYEFMPNESLEKFIFSNEVRGNYRQFSMKKLQEIALGVARGIEYLHQGCNQRILHFDIKPHNILLDHDFNPKISDFGLAKLCSRDVSIVTMTAARGTLGYIAPELYSRNFGTVSYKSDVYSFGMLVLEMVGGRRNTDPTIENQGGIYFPEWVYNKLISDQDLRLITDSSVEEEEISKKLAIIALWCIQWSPIDRPSMTRVVEMLIGDLPSLHLPDKPFVSSTDQDTGGYVNE